MEKHKIVSKHQPVKIPDKHQIILRDQIFGPCHSAISVFKIIVIFNISVCYNVKFQYNKIVFLGNNSIN